MPKWWLTLLVACSSPVTTPVVSGRATTRRANGGPSERWAAKFLGPELFGEVRARLEPNGDAVACASRTVEGHLQIDCALLDVKRRGVTRLDVLSTEMSAAIDANTLSQTTREALEHDALAFAKHASGSRSLTRACTSTPCAVLDAKIAIVGYEIVVSNAANPTGDPLGSLDACENLGVSHSEVWVDTPTRTILVAVLCGAVADFRAGQLP